MSSRPGEHFRYATFFRSFCLSFSIAMLCLAAVNYGTRTGREKVWEEFMDLHTPKNAVFEAVFPPRWKTEEGAPAPGCIPFVPREFEEFLTKPNRRSDAT